MGRAEQIEALLGRRDVQSVLRRLTRRRRDGGCLLADFFAGYGGDGVPLWRRPALVLPTLLTEWIRRKTGASREVLRGRVLGHEPTRRALVNTVRSIGRLGLTRPQRFAAPLLVVWNFTQACNLSCRHCYQSAHGPLPDELDLRRQTAILDDLRANDTSWVAFSGGEPLMGRNFWPVVAYAARTGFHVSVATNGTLLTRDVVKRLVDCGVRYIEISLDSADPDKHDAFRGGRGYWARTVSGIDCAVAQPGVRVGIAPTITRLNLHELPRLIDFAVEHGADTFYAFNFVPVGRAGEATEIDLTPEMREEMLAVLYAELNRGRIAVMSTAAQMGRVCLERAGDDGLVSTGHYGFGKASLARVMAGYVGGCGAGRCYLAIQPNGLVTPCVFMPNLVIGDFRKERLADFWFDHPVLELLRDRDRRTGHCAVCAFKTTCGGCRARPLAYFGDLTRSDPGCIHNQAEWQEVCADAHGLRGSPSSGSPGAPILDSCGRAGA